ncbi:MAG TPA: VCBS repeat-containing protein [Syntrophales bacterium]|nr:VCBS repeat-containing protein [Syntrophales bacterium]
MKKSICIFAYFLLALLMCGSTRVDNQRLIAVPAPAVDATVYPSYTGSVKGHILIARQQTLTDTVDPDLFIASQSPRRGGFWMSQKFNDNFLGMDIGDVNNDGRNEIVVIDTSNIMIYQKEGNTLKLLQRISGGSYHQYLSVDVADINGSGVCQIIVTSLFNDTLESFVLEYKNGKYVEIASDLRWFLRVIEIDGKPILLGQKMGIDNPFDNPIYEIVWKDGKYVEGRQMKIPRGLSVFSLTLMPLEKGGPDRVIAIDNNEYLRVLTQTDKTLNEIDIFGGSAVAIWKSDEVFGGSNNYFTRTQSQSSAIELTDRDKIPYVNSRLISCYNDKTGKKDLIIVRNFSQERRLLQNIRFFSSGEIYDLEWDGLGFTENWKTRKIQGYVADYQFKDIDKKGRKELVLAVVTARMLGFKHESVIIILQSL